MPKISIIIPVYNVQNYLKKCLDSLVSQTFTDLEFICVDDGSTDDSLKILNEYAKNDERFVVISQENQGTGKARNNALKLVQGKYIAFVDPDDWVELDAYEHLYNYAEEHNSQIVQFDYKEYSEYSNKMKNIPFYKHIKKECNYDLLKKPYYNWKDIKNNCLSSVDLHAWSHFYNTEFIKRYNIEFGLNRRAEDHLFTLGAMLVADKTHYLNEYLYFYRYRECSAVNTRDDDNFRVFENIDFLEKFIVQNGLMADLKDELHSYKKQVMIWHYEQTPLHRIKEYEDICRSKLSLNDFEEVMKRVKRKKNFLENIFSLKNEKENGKKWKILTFLGFEVKLKKRNVTKGGY